MMKIISATNLDVQGVAQNVVGSSSKQNKRGEKNQ